MTPIASVIIPTHNRCYTLGRTLAALEQQTYPTQQFEVVVVADGCTDGTLDMLGRYQPPFALQALELPGRGPAEARNCGAAQAQGRLLIFLDDDVEATPALIETHVQAHAGAPGRVVIGYLPPVVQEPASIFGLQLRHWWEAMFQRMRQPGHRYGYWDLLGGNLSLAAELFARVGGFDPTLRCHEDYELGIRLIAAGASLTFAADAAGYHHETTGLDRSLRRKYHEGRADVIIGGRHPALCPSMPLAYYDEPWSPTSRRLRALAFAWPIGGDILVAGLRRVLDLLEWMRLHGRWRRLLNVLLDYWYWRGVAEELGKQKTSAATRRLADFLHQSALQHNEEPCEIELDLREGLEVAEQRLDAARPAGAAVRYGQHVVGHIAPKPGAEQLRSTHLRPILATDLAWPLLKALALEAVSGDGPAWGIQRLQ